MERIRGLESALRQRDSSLQKLNMQLHSKDMQYLQLHAGPDAHSESPSHSCSLCHAAAGHQGAVSVCTVWLWPAHPVVPSGVFYSNSDTLDYRKRIISIRSDVVYAKRISFSIKNAIICGGLIYPRPFWFSSPVSTQFGPSLDSVWTFRFLLWE